MQDPTEEIERIQSEDAFEHLEDPSRTCKVCDKIIEETKHQAGGKHLYRCYDCYLQRKLRKSTMGTEHSEDIDANAEEEKVQEIPTELQEINGDLEGTLE